MFIYCKTTSNVNYYFVSFWDRLFERNFKTNHDGSQTIKISPEVRQHHSLYYIDNPSKFNNSNTRYTSTYSPDTQLTTFSNALLILLLNYHLGHLVVFKMRPVSLGYEWSVCPYIRPSVHHTFPGMLLILYHDDNCPLLISLNEMYVTANDLDKIEDMRVNYTQIKPDKCWNTYARISPTYLP